MMLEKTEIITQTLIEEHQTVGLATYFAVVSSNPLRMQKSSHYISHVFRLCQRISGNTDTGTSIDDIVCAVNYVFGEDAEHGDFAPYEQRQNLVTTMHKLIILFQKIGIG